MATHTEDPRVKLARAINESVNRFPDKLESRLAPVDSLIKLEADKKLELKNAKAVADKKFSTKEIEDVLNKKHGWMAPAIKAIKILEAGSTEYAAAAFRQIFERAKDKGYYVPDLLDAGVFGTGTVDADQPAFDSTTTGKRQGGKASEPKPVDAKPDAAPPAREIPSISLEEAERRFKEAEALHGAKRGPRHKDLKEAKAVLDALQAATVIVAPAPDAVPEGETETTNVVPFAKQQAEANAAGDAMTRGLSASAASAEPAADAQAEPEASKSKPKRTRTAKTPEEKAKIKADAGKPAEETTQATSGPTPPPAMVEDEDEDPDFPTPPVPGQIGTESASYTQR